jgi:hypothetical protein
MVILAFPLFFVARGAWRLWKGIPPRPLDPGAPPFIRRVWGLTPWLDVVWGLVAFALLLFSMRW